MALSDVMFYKMKCEVATVNPEEDLLWKIVLHVKRWQTRKWNKEQEIVPKSLSKWTKLKTGYRIYTEENQVYMESEYFSQNESIYWACTITEDIPPETGVAPRKWITELGFEQTEKGKATFSCVVFYQDRAEYIGAYQEEPPQTVPGLVRNICNDKTLKVTSGPEVISDLPNELHVGDWPAFYERVKNQDRQIPFVFVYADLDQGNDDADPYPVDPKRLAYLLNGNAIVFYSNDPELQNEMMYFNPEDMVFPGTVKVYQAGVLEPYRNRYFSKEEVDKYGGDKIASFLCQAFVRNINYYDTYFRLRSCRQLRTEYEVQVKLQDNLEQQEELHRNIEDSQSVAYEERVARLREEESKLKAEERALRAEAKVKSTEDLFDEQYKQLEKKDQLLYEQRSQIVQMRTAADENASLRKALAAYRKFDKMPETPLQLLEYFEAIFSDRLGFSEDAKKSAKDCTIPLPDLWYLFFHFAFTLLPLYQKGSGDIFRIFKEKTGLDIARGEGKMTRKNNKMMRQFSTSFQNEVVDIEPHLTFGDIGQSIHFGYSPNCQKIIIGHCGEHKEIYSSQKRK